MAEFAPGTLGRPVPAAATQAMVPTGNPFIDGLPVPLAVGVPTGNGAVMLGKRAFSMAFNRDMADPLRITSYEGIEVCDIYAGSEESGFIRHYADSRF